jgi:hypothetical protein
VVVGDFHKPCGKKRFAPESAQPFKYLNKNFLGKITGVIPVSEKPQAQGIDSGLVLPYQSRKALFFSGKNLADDFPVRIFPRFIGHRLAPAEHLLPENIKYRKADSYGQGDKAAQKGIGEALLYQKENRKDKAHAKIQKPCKKAESLYVKDEVGFYTLPYHKGFAPVIPQKPKKNNDAAHDNARKRDYGNKYLSGL